MDDGAGDRSIRARERSSAAEPGAAAVRIRVASGTPITRSAPPAVEATLLPRDLQAYLRQHMPLADAMDVRVEVDDGCELEPVLIGPLEPNRNHGHTFFGGSTAVLVTLAGWAAVHLRMLEEEIPGHLVIQRSDIEYVAPIEGELRARALPPDPSAWDRFRRMMRRRGKGRITIDVIEHGVAESGVRFSGDFVALVDDA